MKTKALIVGLCSFGGREKIDPTTVMSIRQVASFIENCALGPGHLDKAILLHKQRLTLNK